jgi:hypothetical protein
MQRSWSAVDEYVAARLAPEDAALTAAIHASEDAVLAQRQLHEVVAAEDRLSATTTQTVGGKGYDGVHGRPGRAVAACPQRARLGQRGDGGLGSLAGLLRCVQRKYAAADRYVFATFGGTHPRHLA